MPLISVIMPAYNAARHLDVAVTSVLSQTLSDFEFLIVDDGSRDPTPEILHRYAASDPRIRLITQENQGYTNAINAALRLAKGSYIARMDADDECLPERFAQQVDYLQRHPECGVVGSRALLIDSDGDPLKIWDVPVTHELIDNLHVNGKPGQIVHPSTMIRAAALAEAGGYDSRCEPAEDLDLWLRLGECSTLANLPEVLLKYRVLASSVTRARRVEQDRVSVEVVQVARKRRGLPPLSSGSMGGDLPTTERDYATQWVNWAWEEGHYHTARKYARRLLFHYEFSSDAIRLFLKAYLGALSIPIGFAKRTLLKRFPIQLF